MIITPYEIALYYLDEILNIDFHDEANESGSLSKNQTKDLKQAGLVSNQMIQSLNKMLKELSGSDNIDDINWSANMKNRMIMNLTPVVVDEIDDALSDGSHIKWTPSYADDIDPIHALNYGKVMTWGTAKKKGLGTRPNCKCGFIIVNSAKIKSVEQSLTVEGVNLVEKTQ